MTDEEREALRNFKSEYETCNYNSSDLIIELDNAKIILNLIEKQQKEIEELKAKNKILEAISLSFNEIQDRDKKWKDKIKAKTIEIKNRQVKDEFITASQGKLNTIIDMQSLL